MIILQQEASGPLCTISHLWEATGILVILGMWIGAAAMWQYLHHRYPDIILFDREEESKDGVQDE